MPLHCVREYLDDVFQADDELTMEDSLCGPLTKRKSHECIVISVSEFQFCLSYCQLVRLYFELLLEKLERFPGYMLLKQFHLLCEIVCKKRREKRKRKHSSV